MLMVTLTALVQLRGAAMLDTRHAGAQRWRIARGLVGDDPLGCDAGCLHGAPNEGVGHSRSAPRTDVGINDLPSLIDRTLDVHPLPMHATIGLVTPPLLAT